MEEIALKEQISELNRKIDFLLEELALQKAKRQEMEDLLDDLKIIGKDAFNTAVTALDKSDIEVNSECVVKLGLNVVKNVRNFNYLFDTLQSAIDFWQDFAPILRQMGLDAIHKFAELEQKGYFEYLRQLISLMENFMKHFTAEDIKKLNENIPLITGIVRNVTTTGNLKALQNITRVIAETNMDEETDNKSFYQLYKELKSPEVRRNLSYLLRLMKETAKYNNPAN